MDRLLNTGDYKVLDRREQEALCQETLAEIASGQFKPAGEASREHWNRMWSHPTCVPYYMAPSTVLRVNGQFVRPYDKWLEASWFTAFRSILVDRYFQSTGTIYEFGCGSGWNLAMIARIHPEKKLVGLDWAQTAVDTLPPGIHGQQFDFFDPDYELKLDPGCGVLTVGALEQTGKDWEAFLEYLLTRKPAVCVHVEPIVEWYDPRNPVDLTAIQYHLARNYWEGFPARIGKLAAQDKVEILEQKRSYFGSKYIEGYSLFVWRLIE